MNDTTETTHKIDILIDAIAKSNGIGTAVAVYAALHIAKTHWTETDTKAYGNFAKQRIDELFKKSEGAMASEGATTAMLPSTVKVQT